MFELFKTEHKGLGSVVEVSIDYSAQQIKRQYKENGITCNGNETQVKKQDIDNFFQNEVYWLNKLQGEWIPKTLNIDMHTQTIIQEYTGPNLLYQKNNLPENIVEQVIEMYKFFKDKNVFKRNGSMSNLTLKGNKLIAFDFKWAKKRPEGLDMEIKSYNDWLSKIDKNLTNTLKEML
jgi:hypothetical protein